MINFGIRYRPARFAAVRFGQDDLDSGPWSYTAAALVEIPPVDKCILAYHPVGAHRAGLTWEIGTWATDPVRQPWGTGTLLEPDLAA
jgi:hypothetical protein